MAQSNDLILPPPIPQTKSLTYTHKFPDQPSAYQINLRLQHKTPKNGYNNHKNVSSETSTKKAKNGKDLHRTKTDPRDIKASNKSKRTKKEQKKWKKKMKEIGKNHPEFELSYDLLLGIRTSTSTVNSSVIRSSMNPLEPDDSSEDEDEMFEKEFKDSKRYSFPSSGSSQTPPHHMNDFEFKDYCRPIFAQLREWFGIKPQTYLVKLCGGFNLLEFISNSKSGQFFFYSYDGQFLIKSMSRSECKLMRKILPQYYYFVKNQPNTLLTKFYGMYRVKTHNRQPIYFIVMGSVFHTDLDIHRIYDLKGSTHGRKATDKEKQQETPVLKDLDFIENNETVSIGSIKAKLFCEQIRKDTALLRKLKIMDYSLLLGVHYTDRKRADSDGARTPLNLSAANSLRQQYSASLNQTFALENGNPSPPKNGVKPSPYALNDSLYEEDREHTNSDNIKPKQSVTDPIEFSDEDKEEKEDGDTIQPLPYTNAIDLRDLSVNSNLQALRPLKRVTSRRLSQLNVAMGGHNRYTVKTPIENHFDMPELVDMQRMNRMMEKKTVDEEEEEDEYMNIFATDQGGMRMTDDEGNIGSKIYFCGIIDVLQKYNKRKKVENFFRGLNTDTATISAVPPDQYSQRMYDFLKERIK